MRQERSLPGFRAQSQRSTKISLALSSPNLHLSWTWTSTGILQNCLSLSQELRTIWHGAWRRRKPVSGRRLTLTTSRIGMSPPSLTSNYMTCLEDLACPMSRLDSECTARMRATTAWTSMENTQDTALSMTSGILCSHLTSSHICPGVQAGEASSMTCRMSLMLSLSHRRATLKSTSFLASSTVPPDCSAIYLTISEMRMDSK